MFSLIHVFYMQGFVLLMLIMHLIYAVGFQPRLSVIPGDIIWMFAGLECLVNH